MTDAYDDHVESGVVVLQRDDATIASGEVSEAPPSTALPRETAANGWRIELPEATLSRIVRSASRALQVGRCSLALFDPVTRELVTVAAVPPPTLALRRSRFALGEGIAGEVARTARPLLIADTGQDERFKPLGDQAPIKSLICAPLIDDGRVLGTLTAASDRKDAFSSDQLDLLTIFADQAALAVAQAQRADEIERLKSAFLSTISHELKTPLNSIHGFAALLLDDRAGPLTPQQRDFLESVQHSARHLNRLVDDIMQVSLAETDQLCLTQTPTDLIKVIGRVARQFGPELQLASLSLDLRFGEESLAILCDPFRIEQVLANLLSNAIKFTPAGGRVMIAAHRAEDGIEVSVADTGAGIPEAEQSRVFDRFYQVRHGLDRTHNGAGLGLTIVRYLVERHGGRITLTSQAGHGSTFTVWLPVGSDA